MPGAGKERCVSGVGFIAGEQRLTQSLGGTRPGLLCPWGQGTVLPCATLEQAQPLNMLRRWHLCLARGQRLWLLVQLKLRFHIQSPASCLPCWLVSSSCPAIMKNHYFLD